MTLLVVLAAHVPRVVRIAGRFHATRSHFPCRLIEVMPLLTPQFSAGQGDYCRCLVQRKGEASHACISIISCRLGEIWR